MQIVDQSELEFEQLRIAIQAATDRARVGKAELPILRGAGQVRHFLTPAARQLLEGQVFNRGTDLARALGACPSPEDPSQLIVLEAEARIPLLAKLRRILDDLVCRLFDVSLVDHSLQLRVFYPGTAGHPTHVDYDQEFDVHVEDPHGPAVLTGSVSLSVPISWNEGAAPPFIVHAPYGDVCQDSPGSLVIFGPNVPHTTPPPALRGPYVWLVTQAFYTSSSVLEDQELRRLVPVFRSEFGANRVRLFRRTLELALEEVDGLVDSSSIATSIKLLTDLVPAADRSRYRICVDRTTAGVTTTGFRFESPSTLIISCDS